MLYYIYIQNKSFVFENTIIMINTYNEKKTKNSFKNLKIIFHSQQINISRIRLFFN